MMRFFRMVTISALIASPLSAAVPTVPPAALAFVDANAKFCARIDSKSAEKYKEWATAMVKDVDEKELADARNSKEYKETYESVSKELEKMAKEQAAEGCRATLTDSNKPETNK